MPLITPALTPSDRADMIRRVLITAHSLDDAEALNAHLRQCNVPLSGVTEDMLAVERSRRRSAASLSALAAALEQEESDV